MVAKTTPAPSAGCPPDAAARLAAVQHTDDVVEYAMRCVLALAPALSQAIADAADRQVRDVFGLSEVYVATRMGKGLASRNESIRREYRLGERIPYLARKYKLTRSQVYRIIGQPDPGPDVASVP